MRVKAVLFDLDGTLADTAVITTRALTAAFQRAGLSGHPPLAEFHALSGHALEDIFARLGLPTELTHYFRAAATEMVTQSQLFPGARELLTELRGQGIRVGVITGKERIRAVTTLRHLEIDGVVEELVA
ncbi:MAG: HAD family hydrolase, partial [Pseudonocardiaceae bacterium]